MDKLAYIKIQKQSMLKYLSNRAQIDHDTVFDPLNIPIETVINYHGGSLSLCQIKVKGWTSRRSQNVISNELYLVNFIVLYSERYHALCSRPMKTFQRKCNIIVSANNAIDRILKDSKYTDVMKKQDTLLAYGRLHSKSIF